MPRRSDPSNSSPSTTAPAMHPHAASPSRGRRNPPPQLAAAPTPVAWQRALTNVRRLPSNHNSRAPRAAPHWSTQRDPTRSRQSHLVDPGECRVATPRRPPPASSDREETCEQRLRLRRAGKAVPDIRPFSNANSKSLAARPKSPDSCRSRPEHFRRTRPGQVSDKTRR
jgi:hypothetical protein